MLSIVYLVLCFAPSSFTFKNSEVFPLFGEKTPVWTAYYDIVLEEVQYGRVENVS